MNRLTKIKRISIALALSVACINSAVFLRGCKDNLLRKRVTNTLGYEWRAAVEHLLSAIGIPLTVGVAFLGFLLASCWVSHVICKRVGWTWKPIAKHPREITSFEHLAIQVSIWSSGYVLAATTWEWSQAYIGVYGGAPRGYMQWEQLGFDLCGAFIAFYMARWAAKRRS